MQIPDSIQPYIGYKALRIQDGTLYSPNQTTPWPHRKPLESDCGATDRKPTFTWKQIPAPPGWEEHFWVPSSFLKEGTNTFFNWPEQPAPPGYTYIPQAEPHKLTGCRCGIYIVDTPQQCHSYMYDQNHVLCEIAGWGEVVKGDRGVRAQYGYPQRIYAGAQQTALVTPLADNYGVPIEIVQFYEEEV